MTPLDEHLARVVARYGRNALDDPVALEAALRDTAGGWDATDTEQADVVAAAPVVARLRPAGGVGAGEVGAGEGALGAAWSDVVRRGGLPPDRARRAVAALAAAHRRASAAPPTVGGPPGFGPPGFGDETGPPGRSAPDVHRIAWDGHRSAAPTAPLGPPRRRRWPLVVALLLVLAVAGTGSALLTRGIATPEPPPDRAAVEQVAVRYRALGADLLTGALRCAAVAAEPGEQERVTCDFGTFSLVLTTYDAAGRLTGVRAAAARGPDSVRSARAAAEGSTFAMDEQRTGTSALYWDATNPRPVSAAVTTRDAALPDLAGFFDQRRFGPIRRPALPGAAFRSGRLWALARPFADERSARCTAEAPDARESEQVLCTYPDGTVARFGRLTDRDGFSRTRVTYAGAGGTVAGTQRVGVWRPAEGGAVEGQLAEYVLRDDGRPYLYYDQDVTLGYGLVSTPAGTPQDALRGRFSALTG